MKIRLLALVVVLGLGAIALGWVYESRLAPETPDGGAEIPDNVDFYLTGMRLRAIDADGALDYLLDSPRVEHHQRGDISRIRQPRLRIVRAPGDWTVRARRGQFLHGDNLLRLQRDVVMRRAGDAVLELRTEGIRFEPERDLVATEASVTLRDGSARIDAERAVLDLERGVYRLSAARAVYQP